jgi:hypothetical protein
MLRTELPSWNQSSYLGRHINPELTNPSVRHVAVKLSEGWTLFVSCNVVF